MSVCPYLQSCESQTRDDYEDFSFLQETCKSGTARKYLEQAWVEDQTKDG